MIEDYFQRGSIITGFDFKDMAGTPLSEVSTGVSDPTLSISGTRRVAVWFR
jgi:hypothetical protein